MTEDAIFKEQWNLLKKEMAMGDAHLQQRLEQFIFRQYGRAVLTHYIKALSVLELSRHFYLRFRRRSRAVTEPILYWTVLAETTIHMTLEGVKDMHPFRQNVEKVVSQETRQNYTKDRRTKVQQTQSVQKNQQTTEKSRNLVTKKGQKKK